LHQKKLPGTPDIVLPRHRTVILVHGCFWHQHPGCVLAKKPRARPDYWLPKLERNAARDRRDYDELAAKGWNIIVVWECETSDDRRLKETLIRGLAHGRGRKNGQVSD
jgi:DNA mismatch endonuclease (patch repair protein)